MLDRENSQLPDKYSLVKYYIRAINNQNTLKRSYKKVGDFMADVMVILVNLLFLLGLFIIFMNTLKSRQSVMRRVMKYSDELIDDDKAKEILNDIKNSNRQSKIKEIKEAQQPKETKDTRIPAVPKTPKSLLLFNNKKDADIDILDVNMHDDNEKLLEKEPDKPETKVKETHLMGCWDVCMFYICCGKDRRSKERLELYEKAEKNYFYSVDIITYVKKMQELDILKFMLLDEDSLRIMNFISKPGVSYIEHDAGKKKNPFFYDGVSDFQKEPNRIEEIENLKFSYQNLKNKKDITSAEKKIVEYFESQVNDIIPNDFEGNKR